MRHFPGCPFKIIFMLAVNNNNEIQLIHLLENPICLGIAKRKFQLTASKALAISTLKRELETCFQCRREAANCTALKFSCMRRPEMNAL